MRGPGHYDPLKEAEQEATASRRVAAKAEFSDAGRDATTPEQEAIAEPPPANDVQMHVPEPVEKNLPTEPDFQNDDERREAVHAAYMAELQAKVVDKKIPPREMVYELRRFEQGDDVSRQRAEAAYRKSLESAEVNTTKQHNSDGELLVASLERKNTPTEETKSIDQVGGDPGALTEAQEALLDRLLGLPPRAVASEQAPAPEVMTIDAIERDPWAAVVLQLPAEPSTELTEQAHSNAEHCYEAALHRKENPDWAGKSAFEPDQWPMATSIEPEAAAVLALTRLEELEAINPLLERTGPHSAQTERRDETDEHRPLSSAEKDAKANEHLRPNLGEVTEAQQARFEKLIEAMARETGNELTQHHDGPPPNNNGRGGP